MIGEGLGLEPLHRGNLRRGAEERIDQYLSGEIDITKEPQYFDRSGREKEWEEKKSQVVRMIERGKMEDYIYRVIEHHGELAAIYLVYTASIIQELVDEGTIDIFYGEDLLDFIQNRFKEIVPGGVL